ncbi:MAG: L,D-transpeptidase [Actinomycetota bacterium]
MNPLKGNSYILNLVEWIVAVGGRLKIHLRGIKYIRGTKFLPIGISILALIFIVVWGYLYTFAEDLVIKSPAHRKVIADASPLISAEWPIFPLARLASAIIIIDEGDVSESVSLSAVGFSYDPPQRLSEGEHTVEAKLTYKFLFPKVLRLKWAFEVDTIAPSIKFEGVRDIIATRKSWIHDLSGFTEPRAKLRVYLNGRSIPAPEVDEKGYFNLGLYSLSRKNKLKIVAIDRAGNKGALAIPVVVDNSAPVIKACSPAHGSVVHSDNPKISIKLEEPESDIRFATLWIDGKVVKHNYSPKTKEIISRLRLSHGEHEAMVQAIDEAGNSVKRRWSFKVDTTRIVINITRRRLFLYREGQLIKEYPIAVGQEFAFPTPVGHYRIIRKRKNPTWYNPHKPWSANMPDKIPPGPGNPLGTRAMDLNAPGIRIHGTYSSWSIGRAVSHGCIRMHLHHAEELFDLVFVGTSVDIVK